MDPEDSTMVTVVFDAGKNYTFDRKIFDKQHNKITGVVDLIAFDKNKEIGDSTAYARRIMFINEKFIVQ